MDRIITMQTQIDRHAMHAAVTCATCRRVAARIDLRGQK